jgi:uncharacterized protein DUF3667/uncharacterized protein DUF4286
VAATLIYEVECLLDPDIVADYDAWLPGHVREVLACPGFHGASIEIPETPPGERQRRRIRYRVESVSALDHYLENHATRLRTETAQRFGSRVQCERRVFKPRHELAPPAAEARRCLNCGGVVTGKHCAQCGQAADVHVLSMREVAGDVTHSLLHLDSRVWQTIKLLARKPGELTREFIGGRHQLYLPPFRLYLAISLLFFALQALLPDSNNFNVEKPEDVRKKVETTGGQVPDELRKELEAEGVLKAQGAIEKTPDGAAATGEDHSILSGEDCNIRILDGGGKTKFEQSMSAACRQMKADGGKRFAEHFATTAPKLMFLFLPLMAGVALLFYWKPRRLYAEHLVVFLHNHAFTFLLLCLTSVLGAVADLDFPGSGLFGLAAFLLYCYLPYYVFRSMRVVYGEGRFKTTLKFVSISTIYFLLLGITMLLGLVFTMLSLS